jgi:hypothetical protein
MNYRRPAPARKAQASEATIRSLVKALMGGTSGLRRRERRFESCRGHQPLTSANARTKIRAFLVRGMSRGMGPATALSWPVAGAVPAAT